MDRFLMVPLVPWRITTVVVWAFASAALLSVQEIEDTLKDVVRT